MTRHLPPPPRSPGPDPLEIELHGMADAELRGMPNVPPPPRPVSAQAIERGRRADLLSLRRRVENKLRYGTESPGDAARAWRFIVQACGLLLLFGPLLFLAYFFRGCF